MSIVPIILFAAMENLSLKPGAVCHGFTVKSVTDLPEVPAKMVRMEYAKNGADLVWLDRDDDNKTFAIAFKTLPADNTGVAHIIEHSVLCGSEKYPVKEPFVDLLKSSLATFLNAMTWPDKTAYPVSSRNDRDFLNLTDVYLDAVFHPLSVRDDWALKQEGWHYEFDAQDNLVRNGVVYSEMKGVFANPDAIAFKDTMKMLFPDNTYGVESGGNPTNIPELTFAEYKAFHARFYHPSNARIFLDGRVDIVPMLARLDAYLSAFDRRAVDADIPMQKPVSGKRTESYESPDVKNKVILQDGWVFGTFADRKRQLAFSAIGEVLAGSNESPLKKALLDAGLCEDVELGAEGIQQPVAMLLIRNTSEEKAPACRALVRKTLKKLCAEGLDRTQLAAQLDNLEFRAREKDSGSYPRGLAFMEAALDSWLYGGDPADGFRYRALFAELRAELAAGTFEKYLREIMLDNPHHAELTLVPSATLGEERRQADEAALAAIKAKMSPAERARVRAEAAALKKRQSEPDRPEDAAKLPRLAVKDIPLEAPPIRRTIATRDGVTVIRPAVAANGILYLDLAFSLEGLSDAELLDVPTLAMLLGELGTATYKPLALKSELDGKLGRISFASSATERGPIMALHVSALEAHAEDAIRLATEVALRTDYSDTKAIADLLAQAREDLERAVQTGGHTFAMRRAASGLSRQNQLDERFGGIEQLRHLQRRGTGTATLAPLAKKIFTKARLTVCVTDNMPESYADRVIAAWPAGETPPPAPAWRRAAGAPRAEGFEIPAAVGFAGTVAKLPPEAPYAGSQQVAARILSLDYLWNEIRVKGGAYGMGLTVRADGDVAYMTYRDPQPGRSLATIAGAGDALARFVAAGKSFDSYQVATVSKTEPYLSPRMEARRAFDLYFANRAPEDIARLRREILTTTKEELLAFAKTLRDLGRQPETCVVAGKALLKPCKLAQVESVRQAGR